MVKISGTHVIANRIIAIEKDELDKRIDYHDLGIFFST